MTTMSCTLRPQKYFCFLSPVQSMWFSKYYKYAKRFISPFSASIMALSICNEVKKVIYGIKKKRKKV